jgi:3-oxoacyl-[acyl-carrier-protein] synthase III
VLKEPMRVFAPGFGAGAVGGYAILRVDPAVVAQETPTSTPSHRVETTFQEAEAAFG